ncbi:MAG: cystathionine gamma-synthase [Anaerolineaceae bacterium]|jgi:cystathionine beta-lyase/cystathionine gamma-synthase
MNHHFATLAIHAGQQPDPTTGAVIPPIYQTSTYVQEEVGVHKGYEYSRTGNPTRKALETCLAELEGIALNRPVYGLAFASGMAATDMILRLFNPGEHVLASNDVYGGTYRLFERVLRRYGLGFTYVEMSDLDQVRAALRPETRLVWIETPTNPLLKIADITAVTTLAKANRADALVAVDNTFASPYLQQPLKLGADISMHSTTKYLGGHSDVVGGALVTTHENAHEQLKFLQNAAGAVPGPMDCWLTLRGIKTLALRMERHSANAMQIAQFLLKHPAVEQVLYPGLPDHPGHVIARKQMRLFGGMISFVVKGGLEPARRVAAATRIFLLAESLGGVESLIEHPGVMTHASVAGSPLEIDPGLIRLSVGIEHIDDLLADLEQALGKV